MPFQDQLQACSLIYREDRLFAPVLATWVASFGGALHAPITTFYYIELGCSSAEVGYLNSLSMIGTLVLAPVFGWALDHNKSKEALIGCATLCATGCLIRGLASGVPSLYVAAFILGLGSNLWNLVLAYVVMSSASELRSVMVSGYIGQQRFMQLLGKGLYPACMFLLYDMLGIPDKLMRFRILMSICTCFCFFAVINLLGNRHNLFYTSTAKGSPVPQSSQQEQQKGRESISHSNWVSFVAISFAIICQSSFGSCITILWPLYLKEEYGWGPEEYGATLFLISCAGIFGISCHPSIERQLSQVHAACLTLIISALLASIAFPHENATTHVLYITALSFFLGVAETCLQSLATFQMPDYLQGRAWGVLTSIQGIGIILGSSIGGKLFKMGTTLPYYYNGMCIFGAGILMYFVAFSGTMKHLGHVQVEEESLDPLHHPNHQQHQENTSDSARSSEIELHDTSARHRFSQRRSSFADSGIV